MFSRIKIFEQRLHRGHSYLFVILLFLIFFSYGVWNYNHTTASGDMGEFVNNPLRVLNGERPYRDFWLLHSPGEVIFPAIIYKIFGLNINALFLSCIFISALIGSFSFLAAKRFTNNFYSTIISLIVYFNGIPVLYLGPIYLHMYLLLVLAGVFYLFGFIKTQNLKEIFLAGIFVGMAFLFRFHEVGAAALAFVATIIFWVKRLQDKWSFALKSINFFIFGISIIFFLSVWGLMDIWKPMLSQLLLDNMNVAGPSYGIGWHIPYLVRPLQEWSRNFIGFKPMGDISHYRYIFEFSHQIGLLINILASYLLPFIIITISVWFLYGKKLERFDRVILLFFLIWGILTFPKALRRPHITALSQAITPLIFSLVFLLQKSIEHISQKKTFVNILIWIILTMTTVSLFISVPLAIIEKVQKAKKNHYRLSTEYGNLVLPKKKVAKINSIIDFIKKNSDPRDHIFVTSWEMPPFYVLTNRKNPTYYDSLIDLIARPSNEKQKKICNDLIVKQTKLVVHNSTWGLDDKEQLSFSKSCSILQKCIEENFSLEKKHGRYELYVSKDYQEINGF